MCLFRGVVLIMSAQTSEKTLEEIDALFVDKPLPGLQQRKATVNSRDEENISDIDEEDSNVEHREKSQEEKERSM